MVCTQAYHDRANDNLLTGPNLGGSGTRSFSWNADNQPASITSGGVTEQYVYDADGERLSRTRGGVTTYYLGGLAEVDGSNGTVRHLYPFNGQVVAQREIIVGKTNTLLYLHGDHLGSVSLATDSAGAVASAQEFKPWGEVRSGSVAQTTRNYTGQPLDGTGLLYYHARYYDPVLARFTSADIIVPGTLLSSDNALGTIGPYRKAQLGSLTVDFHEENLAAGINQENAVTLQKGFYFQLSADDRSTARSSDGPRDPASLNRYSYVFNNPLSYNDPTGHSHCLPDERGGGNAGPTGNGGGAGAGPSPAGSTGAAAARALPYAGGLARGFYIAKEKFGYLLDTVKAAGDHSIAWNKMGYTLSNATEFGEMLIQNGMEQALVRREISEYGSKWVQEYILTGPSGLTAKITVVWMIDKGTDVLRLVTAYVDDFIK